MSHLEDAKDDSVQGGERGAPDDSAVATMEGARAEERDATQEGDADNNETDDRAPRKAKGESPVVRAWWQRVEQEPYDVEAWTGLFRIANHGRVVDARRIYEAFFERFPTAPLHWRDFAEHEHREGNTEAVEQILGRCLLQNPEPALWKFYVDFVFESKMVPALRAMDTARDESEDAFAEAQDHMRAVREEVLTAYRFALDKVGRLPGSEPLWEGAVSFLKSVPTANDHDRSIVRDHLRKVYQQAIAAPVESNHSLWQEYLEFEKEHAQEALFNSIVSRHEGGQQLAQQTCAERAGYWSEIRPGLLAIPPEKGAVSTANAEAVRVLTEQVGHWRAFLAYEKSNPQGLPQEEHFELMRAHYERALCSTRFFPDLWYDWAMMEHGGGDMEKVESVFLDGVRAAMGSQLLGFVAADFFEGHERLEAARRVYEHLEEHAPGPLVFIQFQRFARRVEGVKAAQRVFSRARRSEHCTAEVFTAAAHLEAWANKNPEVAKKIFKLCRKTFPEDIPSLIAHLSLLMELGDDTNVRAVFESSLSSLPAEAARPVWERYLDYEMHRAPGGGSLSSLARIEQRMLELYPAEMETRQQQHGMLRSLHRYQHYGLLPGGGADRNLLSRCTDPLEWEHTAWGTVERRAIAASSMAPVPSSGSSLLGPPPTSSTAPAPTPSGPSPAYPLPSKLMLEGSGTASGSAALDLVPSDVTIPPFVHRLLAVLPRPRNQELAVGLEGDLVMDLLKRVTLSAEPSRPANFVAPESAVGTGEPLKKSLAGAKRNAPDSGWDNEDEPAASRARPSNE